MPFPSIFDPETHAGLVSRVEKLTPATPAEWGSMNVAQMMAHINTTYDVIYGVIPTKYNALMRFMLKNFIKRIVVGDKPYKKNSRTAPDYVIADERDFEKEKERLLAYMKRVQADGIQVFEGRNNPGFGNLTAVEWSNLFYKHLDHHLSQFGV